MVLLAVILLIPLALIVVGYRDLASAWSPQAARGVLSLTIGLGTLVWLLDNISW